MQTFLAKMELCENRFEGQDYGINNAFHDKSDHYKKRVRI